LISDCLNSKDLSSPQTSLGCVFGKELVHFELRTKFSLIFSLITWPLARSSTANAMVVLLHGTVPMQSKSSVEHIMDLHGNMKKNENIMKYIEIIEIYIYIEIMVFA